MLLIQLSLIKRKLPRKYRSEDWDTSFETTAFDPSVSTDLDLSSVFDAGWSLEEAIRWESIQRTECPATEPVVKGSRSVNRGATTGPRPLLVRDKMNVLEDAFLLSGHTEKEKALNLIEQMKMRIRATVPTSDESVAGFDVGISSLMDIISCCESALLEKDRISLALLGKNGIGKSMLINILLLLTSPNPRSYGYVQNQNMKCLFSEDFQDYKNILENELEAVIEISRNATKLVNIFLNAHFFL